MAGWMLWALFCVVPAVISMPWSSIDMSTSTLWQADKQNSGNNPTDAPQQAQPMSDREQTQETEGFDVLGQLVKDLEHKKPSRTVRSV